MQGETRTPSVQLYNKTAFMSSAQILLFWFQEDVENEIKSKELHYYLSSVSLFEGTKRHESGCDLKLFYDGISYFAQLLAELAEMDWFHELLMMLSELFESACIFKVWFKILHLMNT